MDIQKRLVLHLSLIPGVGPATLQKLLIGVSSNSTDLYRLSSADFVRFGVRETLACQLVAGLADQKLLEVELTLIEKHAVRLITILDKDYPPLLKEIHVPPMLLYCHGDSSALATTSMAVVGSRKADAYGKRVIDLLVPELIRVGITIVSGGALGIDTFAHSKALECGGKTVVVLGSGLLNLYPYANKKLFERIISSGGALISSFPLNLGPAAGNFPARNRIIAGLSRGCLVAQADIKSGARITASFALEQGRDVFAVPGPIDHPLSAGCHALISQGATLVSSADDILLQIDSALVAQRADGVNISVRVDSQLSFDEVLQSDTTPAGRILTACREPKAFDALLEMLGMEMSELQMILFTLQLEGKIEQDFAGKWAA